ncbi:hypothetical protein [Buttiauxella gaviniae]|uniref:hypothetical protein n=1 Tax=Buttiauxella gaviniae TaxID=82990 RepID=UPI003976A859
MRPYKAVGLEDERQAGYAEWRQCANATSAEGSGIEDRTEEEAPEAGLSSCAKSNWHGVRWK